MTSPEELLWLTNGLAGSIPDQHHSIRDLALKNFRAKQHQNRNQRNHPNLFLSKIQENPWLQPTRIVRPKVVKSFCILQNRFHCLENEEIKSIATTLNSVYSRKKDKITEDTVPNGFTKQYDTTNVVPGEYSYAFILGNKPTAFQPAVRARNNFMDPGLLTSSHLSLNQANSLSTSDRGGRGQVTSSIQARKNQVIRLVCDTIIKGIRKQELRRRVKANFHV